MWSIELNFLPKKCELKFAEFMKTHNKSVNTKESIFTYIERKDNMLS